MGLDMYLKKTKRVESLSVEDYAKVIEELPWDKKDYNAWAGLKGICPDIEGVKELDGEVHETGSNSFRYLSLTKEIGYWRKANAIHSWFVENCQDGIDECQLSEVSREDLEELLENCYKVVNKKSNPEETLPPTAGFFFGSTEIDQYYMDDIKSTISILENAIGKTDWEKEIVFYRASW
jgi:hypothetical protein